VIKSLAFFPSQCALNSGPVIEALLASCRDHDIRVVDNSLDADAVLLWSVLWSSRMRANQEVYQHYRSTGRPVIIAEVGALRRNHTWKIALDNINGLGYYGHTQDLDPDRPRRLGLAISKPAHRKDHVLVACQNSHSLQMQAVGDQISWIHARIQDIRRHTDRPIRVRPHPRSPMHMRFDSPGVTIEIPRKRPHTYDDFDLDLGCHAVVNVNSGPGLLAPLTGTPVMVDTSSLAWPLSITAGEIEKPPEKDLDQWLIEIAHTEYEIPEIAQGSWLRRLHSKL